MSCSPAIERSTKIQNCEWRRVEYRPQAGASGAARMSIDTAFRIEYSRCGSASRYALIEGGGYP